LKIYDSNDTFFHPLRNDEGVIDVIAEGFVATDTGTATQHIWLCHRCNRSLRARKIPKFSRASGLRIGDVPKELAVLNRIEARLVGLGISFTTCVNLYRDGQEFTRGNAINYWNEPAETVRELPRPLKSCGVVFLKSTTDSKSSYFRVRPKLVREALMWLILNNPLYKRIIISEQNLQASEGIDVDEDVPRVTITEDEVRELRGAPQNVNENGKRSDIAATQSPYANCNISTENSTPSEMETEIGRVPHYNTDISLTTEATQTRQNVCGRSRQHCDLSAANTNGLIAEIDSEPQQLQNENEEFNIII
jgi:hypothetical protein